MKRILFIFLLLIGIQSNAQKRWNYKIGWVTPIPFYLQTKYTADVSSALVQVRYSISEKLKASATTGYLRFRPNEPEFDLFSNVPLMFGATYDISDNLYLGLSAGPSYFNEDVVEKFRVIYSPYLGYQTGNWSVDLQYFNWEEVPDETNSLVLCISYNF